MSDHARRHLRPAGRCRVWSSSVFGHRSIVLENRWIRVTVLPDRGGLIHELLWKPADFDLLWRWDRGLPPAGRTNPSIGLPQGGYQDSFVGGWDLMLPAVGRLVPIDGSPIGSHGEVWAMPWDVSVALDRPDVVEVTLSTHCLRTPFDVSRTFRLADEPRLECRTEVRNRGAVAVSYAIGEHAIWTVSDLLQHSGRIIVAGGQVRTHPEQPPGSLLLPGACETWQDVVLGGGARRDLSTVGPGDRGSTGLAVVTAPEGRMALRGGASDRPELELTWDPQVMPHLLLWLSFGGDRSAPWFGTTELLGAEPVSALPWADPTSLPLIGPGDRVESGWQVTVGDNSV